jgi:hypothetical protein
MKTLLLLALFSLAPLVALPTAAAAQTNFSGTWSLDKGKSQGLPPMMENVESYTLVVAQDANQLVVETKIVGGGGGGQGAGGGRGRGGLGLPSATYKLDGTETTVETGGQRPGTASLKGKASDGGKKLELVTTRTFTTQNGEMTLTTKETWELADGGKTLKVHRTSESPRGTMESTLVFAKQ